MIQIEESKLKLVLEALKKCRYRSLADEIVDPAITAIKEVLAEHAMREAQRLGQEIEQAPVAWTLLLTGEHTGMVGKAGEKFVGAPDYYQRVDVYTAPPQPEKEPEEHRLLRRKWFGHRDTGHLSFTEAVDVTMEKIYTQPEQEPVAWMDADGNVSDNNDHKCFPIPLYTQPPQRTWVGLTDEEVDYFIVHRLNIATKNNLAALIRICEAKLKKKNGYAAEKNT